MEVTTTAKNMPAAASGLEDQRKLPDCSSKDACYRSSGQSRDPGAWNGSRGRAAAWVRAFLHRKGARWKRLESFVRGERGGATALAAAALTVMTVGGSALTIDHLWLVDQRDTLKRAANAAGVAATSELNNQLQNDSNVSDAALLAVLQEVAERYLRMNLEHLPKDRLDQAQATLVVTVTLNRDGRSVNVTAQADLGGFILGGRLPFLADAKGPAKVRAESRTDTLTSPVEVVLAIDVSGSMELDLAGGYKTRNVTRMEIVKGAAKSLVDILNPNEAGRVAIGILPWNQIVALAPDAAQKWANFNWARYPRRRGYGVPYKCEPHGNCVVPAAIEEDLPPASVSDPWRGCLDGTRMGTGVSTQASVPDSDDFFTLPSANPFAQGFFVSTYGSAYTCLEDPLPASFLGQLCHEGSPPRPGPSKISSQLSCRAGFPQILPLSTSEKTLVDAIDALAPKGGYTYSALGVLWAQRLLQHTWRNVWGGTVHPVNVTLPANQGLRKAIVLLTDGEDTHCGVGNESCEASPIGTARSDACNEAKAQGTEIFVVAAMHPDRIGSDFETSLRECSSASPDSEYRYVFVNNSTKAELEAAFADIANQLRTVRRSY